MADNGLEGELEVAEGGGVRFAAVVVDEVWEGDFDGDVDVSVAADGATVCEDGVSL